MKDLPEYLKKLGELEKKQCRGPWSENQGYLEVCDDMGMARLSSNLACLTELQSEFLILCRNYLPQILKDMKEALLHIEELREGLSNFVFEEDIPAVGKSYWLGESELKEARALLDKKLSFEVNE